LSAYIFSSMPATLWKWQWNIFMWVSTMLGTCMYLDYRLFCNQLALVCSVRWIKERACLWSSICMSDDNSKCWRCQFAVLLGNERSNFTTGWRFVTVVYFDPWVNTQQKMLSKFYHQVMISSCLI
jgi:hypothetical protein